MPVYVRGGSILPMHQAALTSSAARNSSYDLLVALSNGTASGELYQDEIDAVNGDEQIRVIQFSVVDSVLSSKVTKSNYNGSDFTDSIANVVVLGVEEEPSQVIASSSGAGLEFTYNATSQVLSIDLSNASLSVTQDFTISWL